jgi:glycosyltransferase involved in cell wall biosynthesis
MHIAVNVLLIHGSFSGVQHAIVHQLRALLNRPSPHRFTLIAVRDVDLAEALGPTTQPYDVIRAPFSGEQRFQRICWEQSALPALLRASAVNLLYAPGYLTSLAWQGPSVVFVHDTIALSHPRLCTWSNALNYRLLLPPSARHATRVAVPSQASAHDVQRYCDVPAARIDVAPLGVVSPPPLTAAMMEAARARVGAPPPFLLAVSTIEPKKNFAALIRWFGVWKRSGLPHHLVIVGKWGWKYADVLQALRESPVRAHIHLPGYLSQETLPPLMAAADLLLMPSLYEGFGLPALEGLAVGTLVVVSDQGALPETVGPAGVVLPLEDARWEAEIPQLLADPDRLAALRAAGPPWAQAHSWEHCGDTLLRIFEKATELR